MNKLSSLNVSVLGENAEERAGAAALFGKKGSVDDIGFYHTVFQGKIVSAIDCVSYPAKLSPLLQAIELGDFALVLASRPSPALGEIIVALDFLQKPSVFVSELDLAPFLSPTNLRDSKIFSSANEAKEFLYSWEVARMKGDSEKAIVFIDHCFEVKGVGTVALGVVKKGVLRVHERMNALPLGKLIEVKSIQKNDDNMKEALAGDRVGLCIKGAESSEVPRGTVLASENSAKAVSEFECVVRASKFLKSSLKGEAMHLAAGLQFVPAALEIGGGSEVLPGGEARAKILCEKPVALGGCEIPLLCDLNAKGLRVLASAKPV